MMANARPKPTNFFDEELTGELVRNPALPVMGWRVWRNGKMLASLVWTEEVDPKKPWSTMVAYSNDVARHRTREEAMAAIRAACDPSTGE